MKIQVVSDTHEDLSRFKVNTSVDLVIHAGDFSKSEKGCITFIEDFVNKCSEVNIPCAFVLGNHDYYGDNFNNSSIEKECFKRNYNLITLNKNFVFKDYTFIGGLFGTDFELPSDKIVDLEFTKSYCKYNIMDFYAIYKDDSKSNFITPQDYIELFNKYVEYLDQYRHKENIILVTHFPISSVCLDPRYINNPLNPYFINDVNLEGFKNIISGHTHLTNNFKVQDTNIYINASGYSNMYGQIECPSFDTDFIIEV